LASFTLTTRIDAPPAEVFAVAADFERIPQIIRGIKSIEFLTPGPIRVGTRFRETRVMFGRDSSEEMTVTAFDPPHGCTLEAYTCGAQFISEHRFKPDGAGTLLELSIRTEPRTLLAKLASPLGALMAGTMKKMILQDMEDLKAAVERMKPRRRDGHDVNR
jgi:carbon monoxide dehydrogenase subunit G